MLAIRSFEVGAKKSKTSDPFDAFAKRSHRTASGAVVYRLDVSGASAAHVESRFSADDWDTTTDA